MFNIFDEVIEFPEIGVVIIAVAFALAVVSALRDFGRL